MHFFVGKLLSIAVITYTYVRPKSTSSEPADLSRIQLPYRPYAKTQATVARILSFDASFLENTSEYQNKLYIARN